MIPFKKSKYLEGFPALLCILCRYLPLFFALLCVSCNTVDLAKKYPNMIANLDPYQIGSIRVSLDRFFSFKVQEHDVKVIFYPRENEVALEFMYEFINYRQFWDEDGRQLFKEALDRYKGDFANQNLISRYNKTRTVYGKLKARTEWETFKFTATYYSLPVIELGYRFKSNTPYFTVLQNSAKDESGLHSSNKVHSTEISIYFSRSQAEDLVKLFDMDFLLSTIEDKVFPAPASSGQDVYIR